MSGEALLYYAPVGGIPLLAFLVIIYLTRRPGAERKETSQAESSPPPNSAGSALRDRKD